jgi:hypothetical protein
MAIYNTSSDAANTAVRAFLTSVGEFYYGASFNTSSGKGRAIWTQIQKDLGNSCAYCGCKERLQIEHLVMFNRAEYGLHHPGNVVPVCNKCNGREKYEQKYVSWQTQLERKSKEMGSAATVTRRRRKRIENHIKSHKYPELTEQERGAIAVIAESLYENIKTESQKSLALYRKLHEVFVAGEA